MLDKAQDAIFLCDLQLVITYWNKGAERIYGWAASRSSRMPPGRHRLRRRSDFVETALEALSSTDEWKADVKNFRRDGTPIVIESRWSLVRSETEEPEYYLIQIQM